MTRAMTSAVGGTRSVTLMGLIAALWLALPTAPSAQDWAQLERYRTQNTQIGAAEPGENRVVFLGDSITEGWSVAMPEFFTGKPHVNRGISGQTTPQMLVRFRADVIALEPAAVVILAGTNDIAGNTGPTTLETIAGHIASMCELAQAHGIKVVLSSVLPAADYPWSPGKQPARKIPALNEILKTYAADNGIVYLDYFSEMSDGSNGLLAGYTSDGVHVTAAGYELMARLAEESIGRALRGQK